VSRELSNSAAVSADEALASALEQEKHVMVFTNAAEDPRRIEEVIKRNYPESVIYAAPLSFFHRSKQLLEASQ